MNREEGEGERERQERRPAQCRAHEGGRLTAEDDVRAASSIAAFPCGCAPPHLCPTLQSSQIGRVRKHTSGLGHLTGVPTVCGKRQSKAQPHGRQPPLWRPLSTQYGGSERWFSAPLPPGNVTSGQGVPLQRLDFGPPAWEPRSETVFWRAHEARALPSVSSPRQSATRWRAPRFCKRDGILAAPPPRTPH